MAIGVQLERILSRPAAKPFRSRHLADEAENIHTNDDGQLDFGPDDIENPHNWSVARRWYITLVAILLTVNATFASSSPTGAYEDLAEHFQVSEEATGLIVTLFLLGYCAGPLIWAPLCEFYGRRYVLYAAFIGYFAFTFLCTWAPNFGGMLVGRFLSGSFASAALSNVPGMFGDMWSAVDRGNAMAVFSAVTFIGPALGPVISGFLEITENWRWTFYVLLWLAAGTLPLMFTIPETLGSQILLRKARRIRAAKIPGFEDVQAPVEASDRTLMALFKITLTRPWQILFDPIALCITLYLSVVYMLLYMLFDIYPIIFQEIRGFNPGVGELPLIGTIIGAFIGGIVVFTDSQIHSKKARNGKTLTPEDRLPLAMIGGVMFPLTMLWFAWSGNYAYVNWAVPAVAGIFLATSIMLIFVVCLIYLGEAYLMYAASAIAVNTIFRSACGAATPLFTNQMFDALTVGGAGSLIAGVAALLATLPFLFYRWGPTLRRRSRFAPTKQQEPQKEGDEEQGDAQKEEDGRTQEALRLAEEQREGGYREARESRGEEEEEVEKEEPKSEAS